MSLVRLNDVSVQFDKTPVLREASFRLERGDRVGLIGKNGSGKSTLLKLVLDQLPPTTGTVSVQDDLKIGYFSQFSELDGSQSVLEVLSEVFADVRAVEAELASIEAAMGDESTDADTLDRLVERQAELFDEMERLEGWDVERQIDTALTKLGFNQAHRTCPIDSLSGGWRNRASLAKILLEKPDVLLFDEPTNYLDVAGVEWVESWFGSFRGAAIVVSHDRAFLDGVVNRIVEVDNHHLQEYSGNFATYVVEKQLRFKTLEKQFVHEAELLAYEAEGIASRREAARNKGKNLGKRLAKIRKSKGPRPVDQILTEIYRDLHTKDCLCEVRGLTKAYGDNLLFSGLSFDIRRRQRLAILGPNGSGKSTLLRALTGAEEADEGTVEWTRGQTFVSYNRMLDELDPKDTVTHAVNGLPDSLALSATKKAVGRFLTMFQFSEADMKARIGTLSGGQKARVAMAQCLLSGASVLVLDEPTNHLDMTSAQVMERALAHFPGAVVVVSHDRFFIAKVATRLIEFGAEGAAPGELRVRAA
ncbi:MAG: ATPase subunit of ABC transporter with duplicated ATPase domains [Myxococcota bacterium]|jgi:ATPase subunit of ABC transporter with duplicated ATPase domains